MSNEAKILIGIGILTIVLLVGGVWFLGRGESKTSPVIDSTKLVRADSYQTGTGTEKVTLVEFADFQCPGCAAASSDIEKIAHDYQGKVNLVYRYFPLSQHPHARTTAAFAEAAGKQGKFWESYKKLFDNQNSWTGETNIDSFLEKYASELGLDYEKIKMTMDLDTTKNKIQRDYDEGVAVGVNSTPTIFILKKESSGVISNEKLELFPTYTILKQKIEEKLSN